VGKKGVFGKDAIARKKERKEERKKERKKERHSSQRLFSLEYLSFFPNGHGGLESSHSVRI